jgi:hypothetical protein
MRSGLKRNQMYLTSENSEHQYGFYFRDKKFLERWNPNLDNKYSSATMMDQNPSNIIMWKHARFLPLEISISYLSQMTRPHQNLLLPHLMHLVRGSLREAHSHHQAIKVIA